MKSMLPGGSRGLSTARTHPSGKEPALIIRQCGKVTSKLQIINSRDPEIRWPVTTVCMKRVSSVAILGKQMLWADRYLVT